MKQSEADRLASNLVSKFGLAVKATTHSGSDGQHVIIEPEDVHPNEGFAISILVGWRSLNIEFVPGKFAADLISYMSSASVENKHIFSGIAGHIIEEKGSLLLKINGAECDPTLPNSWPSGWKSLSFSLRKSPLEINTDDHALTEHLINLWVERFFGCVISLTPLEETTDNPEIIGLPEGAVREETVNRYERSRFNRSICLNFHGTNCKACGMDFRSIYGEIGAGFIHVHHIIPVSRLGAGYIINPIDDLIPVCPNCHAMLHRKDPPYLVDELKEIIKNKDNQADFLSSNGMTN